MTASHPKVSIGLPVFNGEKYLRESINSILSQTFTDFELIISDNASTDLTQAICEEYAVKDLRVRYYRNSSNIGGHNNANQTIKLARGQYFKLAADDDICAPELLAKLVNVLDKDPSIVLCYSTFIKIDENGREIGLVDTDMGSSAKPQIRFQELANEDHYCEACYGLIESAVLRKTDLYLNYSDADRTLLCELSLYGKYYRIPEPLFYKRYHPKMSTLIYPDAIERMEWFNPSNQEKIQDHFELKRLQLSHYLKIISRAPLTFQERIRCYVFIIQLRSPSIAREGVRKIRRKLFLTRETLSLVIELFFHPNKPVI